MSKVVKCKFCEWQVPLFRTQKNGKTLPPDVAWDELKWHAKIEHPQAFKKVAKKIKRGSYCQAKK